MTYSGFTRLMALKRLYKVLIPLLLDDLLWGVVNNHWVKNLESLNPSFAGWPTLGEALLAETVETDDVLIPLLLDDLLWDGSTRSCRPNLISLNPSFAGWPTLGEGAYTCQLTNQSLNPSFAGWPTLGLLWVLISQKIWFVLIPLLLDDLLWETVETDDYDFQKGLNPSFAGWPTLGSKECT